MNITRNSAPSGFEPILPSRVDSPPAPKDGWVPRRRLVAALQAADDVPVLMLDAPVGYGKSTLLSQWLAVDGLPFAWLSLEDADSDPSHLVGHLVRSVRRRIPGFGASVEPVLEVSGSPSLDGVAKRLLDEMAQVSEPFRIVMDDVQALRHRPAHDLLERMLAGLPPTIQVTLSSRSDPPVALGRLRANGALFELRAADLRFDDDEALALLDALGVRLRRGDLATLVERTEGWPAAIYLATLSLRKERDTTAFIASFAGSHRHVADYLSEEVLRRLPPATRRFLLRTSVVPRLSGELCDAVLGASGADAMLDRLERSNLFVIALDDERRWYRYHHLFRQMLHAELSRRDPALVPMLHARASEWLEAEGWHEEAVEQALLSGDEGRCVELISRNWLLLFNVGRLSTVARWLGRLGEEAVRRHPIAALTAAWVAGLTGQPEAMERWLGSAERGAGPGPLPDGTASIEAGVAIVRGMFGYGGLEARASSLAIASELEPGDSAWRPFILWGLGHVALLRGDPAEAKAHEEDALRVTDPRQAVLMIVVLAVLSVAETELGHADRGLEVALRANAIVEERGLSSDPRSSGVCVALGVALSARGDLRRGREALERALALRRSSGRLSPWATLEVLIPLARVRLMQGEVEGSRELVDEARGMLAELDDAGAIPEKVEAIDRLVRRPSARLAFGEELSDREMMILRLMPTQLTQREIGAELFVSLNTVKTHSRAIYRKMGIASRREAVERARELGLL